MHFSFWVKLCFHVLFCRNMDTIAIRRASRVLSLRNITVAQPVWECFFRTVCVFKQSDVFLREQRGKTQNTTQTVQNGRPKEGASPWRTRTGTGRPIRRRHWTPDPIWRDREALKTSFTGSMDPAGRCLGLGRWRSKVKKWAVRILGKWDMKAKKEERTRTQSHPERYQIPNHKKPQSRNVPKKRRRQKTRPVTPKMARKTAVQIVRTLLFPGR